MLQATQMYNREEGGVKGKGDKNKNELSLDFSFCGGALVGTQSKQSNVKSVVTLIQKNRSDSQVMGSLSVNNPLFRSESFGQSYYNYYYPEQNYTMMEKRQLFLRSYQFCRKKSLTERIRGSLVRVKKVVWLRLRSARRLRWLVFSRLKCAFYYRRRRFSRLLNSHSRKSESSSCFW